MKQILIVGAGASGLMAGIAAARGGARVTILEKQEKPGKKLLVTGNGRCNLTNTDMKSPHLYRGEDPFAALSVIEKFPYRFVMEFFEELGLLLKDKKGYIYPYVEQAAAVLEVLLMECRRLKIKIKCTERVEKFWKEEHLWHVKTNTWVYQADALILSSGSNAGAASPDSLCYEMAEGFSLSHTPQHPSLVPLKVRGDWYKKMAGVRSYVKLRLYIGEGFVAEEEGELQWTDYGISGIVVFQLSGFAVKALYQSQKPVISVDLLPQYTKEELEEFLCTRREKMPDKSNEEILVGVLHKKVIPVLLKKAELDLNSRLLNPENIKILVSLIKELKLQISGSALMSAAQVCQGGVKLSVIEIETMEVKKIPGLYITGELLDVDGACGGYNLQWAWSSGYTAGKSAAKESAI